MLLFAATLVVSCDSPQKLALKELAAAGIEPSGRALVQALHQGNTKLTSLLLEARVYTEQRDSRGRTPLMIAVDNHDAHLTLMLINAGANTNASLSNKASVLGIAAGRGDAAMVHTLLAAGARPDGLMEDGEKILPWAIRRGRLELVRTMMKADSDPHLKDSSGNPLLHVAMESGRRDLMESLIELGADPGATNAAGETTIHLALRQGWLDLIPKLAAAGADPNAPVPGGQRPLEQALVSNNSEKAALFLRIGADPNLPFPDHPTDTPLRRVFNDPNPQWFHLFLKHGARPPDGSWDSWLWTAFQNRDFNKTGLLLAHGARPGPGPHGLTLVEAAVIAGQPRFVKLLLDYSCPAGRSILLCSNSGNHEIASLLLAGGVSPNLTSIPTRDTALSIAVRKRHDRVADLLVAHGADTTLSIPEGQSLFHLTVATACHQTLKRLLDAGADPNAPFALPVSPAFLKQVRPGVMRWILKMDRGATPLMMAADSGNIHTARYLMRAGAKTGVHTRASSLWPINFASRRGDVAMMRLFLGQDPIREERCIEVRISEQRARVYRFTRKRNPQHQSVHGPQRFLHTHRGIRHHQQTPRLDLHPLPRQHALLPTPELRRLRPAPGKRPRLPRLSRLHPRPGRHRRQTFQHDQNRRPRPHPALKGLPETPHAPHEWFSD